MYHGAPKSPRKIWRLRDLLYFSENLACLGLISHYRAHTPQRYPSIGPIRKEACSLSFCFSLLRHSLYCIDYRKKTVREDERRIQLAGLLQLCNCSVVVMGKIVDCPEMV